MSRRRPSGRSGTGSWRWIAGRFGPLAYARIDVVPGPGEAPVVLECELAEPSLFLATSPGAADRLARAIAETMIC